jgi:hypothetical protein
MPRLDEEMMNERKKETFSGGEESRLIYLLTLGGGVISFRPQLSGQYWVFEQPLASPVTNSCLGIWSPFCHKAICRVLCQGRGSTS